MTLNCQNKIIFLWSVNYKYFYYKMDLLGSIMNSMDRPPALSEKERLAKKSKILKLT